MEPIKPPTWLSEYKRDVYSQTGEDGIIEKILEIIPERDKWCVEFGALDGRHLSNTRNLIEDKEYSAVMIESDEEKFRRLQGEFCDTDAVITINRFVGFTESDNLDQILGRTPIPVDFDLLSIDIDGNDYHVWKATEKYRPKVVVVEFNPTIPTCVRFVQPAHPSVAQGASLLSLVELAKGKGYELVSVLPHNAFFVRQEYYESFRIESNAPEVLRTDLSGVTWLFSGYDGTVFLTGSCSLLWHNHPMRASRIQFLPKFFQTYPANWRIRKRLAYQLYRLLIFRNQADLLRSLSNIKQLLPPIKQKIFGLIKRA